MSERQIIKGMALALWAYAYREHDDTLEEDDDYVPPLPEQAMKPAEDLAALYVAMNGCSLEEMSAKVRHRMTPEQFGGDLAEISLVGEGGPRVLKYPAFAISFDGNLLEWEGDEEGWVVLHGGLPERTRNPAAGPTRAGEQSRFRTTLRSPPGATRHTQPVRRQVPISSMPAEGYGNHEPLRPMKKRGKKRANPGGYKVECANEMLGTMRARGSFDTEDDAKAYADLEASRSRSFATFTVVTASGRPTGYSVRGRGG